MFRVTLISGALAASAAAVLAAPAHAAAGCTAPAAGYRACLDAHWTVDHGDVTRVKAQVTLLERVPTCGGRAPKRAIVRVAGTRIAARRTHNVCHQGVVRWRTTFTRDDTTDWSLRKGDVLELGWSGTQALASVKLTGGGTKTAPAR